MSLLPKYSNTSGSVLEANEFDPNQQQKSNGESLSGFTPKPSPANESTEADSRYSTGALTTCPLCNGRPRYTSSGVGSSGSDDDESENSTADPRGNGFVSSDKNGKIEVDSKFCIGCDWNPVEEMDVNIRQLTRYSNGTIKLRNPHINFMDQDILYHLALGSESHDLIEMFHDVKFVCIGGTPKRMEEFAYYIMKEIDYKIPSGTQLLDISQFSYRYSMYKTGPVLSISHGMGIPSVSILLHEVIKLMYHAKVSDPIFFRIGTCGGIGIDGGTVIITEEALNSDLKSYQELTVLGKKVRRPGKLDKRLCDELLAISRETDEPYETISGKTMCTDDFYEGQGRLDGAFCDYSEKEKMSYIHHLQRNGVTNIEMESLAFAALTHHAGIRAAVVCVTLLDRMRGDQVLAPKEVLNEWQRRPQKLVARYIKKQLGLIPQLPSIPELSSPCQCPHNTVMPVKSPRRITIVQQESQSYD